MPDGGEDWIGQDGPAGVRATKENYRTRAGMDVYATATSTAHSGPTLFVSSKVMVLNDSP
ncbi:hypothetical protein GGTG_01437 [Gaeumannomyces tritici R3-111a-1]|uniref:Uncharacterized protein n=1 Tax=Gaeumannomyces tritici (strain R3-111a-1) TaxID=644352 RepID=J3NJK6_GAET3|nr:hypothetical protein GGTG_01437 [Gaeumannomyces tritici R3-111a-1]EJT81458.1 hypothetical protein GGTG_01437 [Gaeumannomyces tritici R3-111a-1]